MGKRQRSRERIMGVRKAPNESLSPKVNLLEHLDEVEIKDERVAYGTKCSWWGLISEVSTKPSGLPCCPGCGGVLFEVDSEKEWWKQAAIYEKHDNPGYTDFLAWCKGKCYRSLDIAKAEYAEVLKGR